MTVATLTFQLPEEGEEHQLALNAGKMDSIIRDFDEYLRGLLKYDPRGLDIKSAETIRAELHKLLDAQGVRLW
jgi:hypothetical protein